jgi:hypothetical protein
MSFDDQIQLANQHFGLDFRVEAASPLELVIASVNSMDTPICIMRFAEPMFVQLTWRFSHRRLVRLGSAAPLGPILADTIADEVRAGFPLFAFVDKGGVDVEEPAAYVLASGLSVELVPMDKRAR